MRLRQALRGFLAAPILFASLAAAAPSESQAGLIMDFASDIDASAVKSVVPGENSLTFVYGNRERFVVRLPKGTRDQIIEWAAKDLGGPLVFSIDGSLVSDHGDQWAPPGVSPRLTNLLFQYDEYAHAIACGAMLNSDPMAHPLVASTGSYRRLPHQRYETLLDPSNKSTEASWYRHLAARFITPPRCIGEMTFRVRNGEGPKPIRVDIDSWLHQLTSQWYRQIDVPTESDRWALRLPFNELKRDMEQRWDRYRSVFTPLDELTSIVEAMALLRAVRGKAPDAWFQLRRTVPEGPNRSEPASTVSLSDLDRRGFDTRLWQALSVKWIGGEVDTPAEANLALHLLYTKPQLKVTQWPEATWWKGIEEVAKQDSRTSAKLKLARILQMPLSEPNAARDIEALFSLLRKDFPDAFRLRAQALNLLDTEIYWAEVDSMENAKERPESLMNIKSKLEAESKQLLNDFVTETERHCKAPRTQADDVNLWESLSQNVYSVGLLRRSARMVDTRTRVLEAVACIHYRRALARQVGRELAYQHAHYRFLGYLSRQTFDRTLRERMKSYQTEIAKLMGLPESGAAL